MVEPETKYDELRQQLTSLLAGLTPATGPDVRTYVLELVDVHFVLRALGVSLFPDQSDDAARDRLLSYMKRYPLVVIGGEELLVVAGIQEWARRVRELKTQFGWKILSGLAINQMSEGDDNPDAPDLPDMKPGEYVLVDQSPDLEAAHRWHQANSIRKKKDGSVLDKIRTYLLANVGKQVSGEELRYVAGDKSEWARRVRELRTEHGWQVVTKSTGRPDLPVGIYVMATDRQAAPHDRVIEDRDRRAVMMRDDYSCQSCGWNRSKWDPADPRNLEVHHVEHHARGGSNEPANLRTLCNVCHDEIHAKERAGR